MSNLVFVHDERFQHHLTPETHPESPNRLAAIEQALQASDLLGQLETVAPRIATAEELCAVHSCAYIEELEKKGETAVRAHRPLQLDADTWMSGESFETAKLAAGAGLAAIDCLASGSAQNSFVAVRPPGHHALAAAPMGFCLFNNIAVAARYAQRELGLKRILIIDWDVHHGNGTQDMFFHDPSVCFVSFHQYPFWPPDSGWYSEDGVGEGKGHNINIPLPAGTGDRGYLKAWDTLVKPIAMEYRPELVMLSAGYDAHEADPLGQQMISTPGYFLLSRAASNLARENKAKLACFLEGGYNTRSLSAAVVATMKVLSTANESALDDLKPFGRECGAQIQASTGDSSEYLVDQRIAEIKKHFGKYWKTLRNPA